MRISADDEERIRRTGKLVNEKIKYYAQQFGIDDKQDLLAMAAFDILIEKNQKEEIEGISDESIFERINNLNNLIAQST
jgi:cell division protein ZapA